MRVFLTIVLAFGFGANCVFGSDVNPICNQPPVRTNRKCRGMFPRYTYDMPSGTCQLMVYGGCGATDNLFVTKQDCMAACSNDNRPQVSRSIDVITFPEDIKDENICHLPPITPGPLGCMAFIKKWTFSVSEGKCVSYVYGGCRGTRNLFDSEEECVAQCPGHRGRSLAVDAEVCSLPISPGPCRAIKTSFAFNKQTGRCEPFNYGGCKGNANRFSTVEDCVNTCGGLSEPLVSLTDRCHTVKCDRAEENMKVSQGCKPITAPGECCPSSWDCSAWKVRIENKDKCWFNGQFYNQGEPIEDVTEKNGCSRGCYCDLNRDGLAVIECAHVDCFQPRDFSWESCRPKYKGLNECCMNEFTCGDDLRSLTTCQLDNKTYYAGEKMYPEADSCVTCLCGEGWDGDLNGEHCSKANCDLTLSGDKLLRGCTPVYQDGVCCPVDWVCPTSLTIDTQSSKTQVAVKDADKCLLPKDQGPCKMAKEMWYFDVSSRKCETFNFGGCKGNENRFETKEECERVCQDLMPAQSRSSPCHQEKAPGRCKGFEKKFYYNAVSGQCNEFIYTGCQGNDNRFDSLDECQAACDVVQDKSPKPGKDTSVCDGPVSIGRCRSRILKFYYNKETGVCQQFFYSGCQGGSNMFDTETECREVCVQPQHLSRSAIKQDLFISDPCQQQKDPGPCRAAKPRFFFNKHSQNCESFLYGGCLGNDNNFATSDECRQKCSPQSLSSPANVRTLNVDFSTLPERIPFPVNPPVARPGQVGGGCPGCPSSSPITPDVKMVAAHGVKKFSQAFSSFHSSGCNAKIFLQEILEVNTQVVAGTNYIFTWRLKAISEPGCEAVKPSLTCSNVYIHKPLQCKKENFSNCLELIRTNKIDCGKDMGEEEVVEVESASADEEFDPCFLEKSAGRCRGSFNRYHFNPSSKSCVSFKYGGCMGNANNFADKKSCQQRCGHHMEPAPRSLMPTPVNPVCKLPMEAGPCYALKPRYFFNFETRRCEEFIYGGCRGNENNFATKKECISSCGKHPRGLPTAPAIEAPRCTLANETFAIGDIVRLPGSECKSCVCSSPPELSCFVTKCPMKAFVPPRGGVNCVMQRDELGCCDTGYKCDSLTPSMPPVGGGYPVLGGYGGPEPVDHEQKIIAAVATKQFLASVDKVTGSECSHLTLLEVLDFRRQIVAGTNFRMSLKLRSKSGNDCSETVERVCDNIVLYRPLPYACSPTKDNNQCLTLSSSQDITCH